MIRILFSILLLVLTIGVKAEIVIGSYNIRNFDYDQRARIHTNKHQLANLLNDLKFDLLGINEINDAKEFSHLVSTKLDHYQVVLSQCGGAHGQKVGFIYKTSKLELLSFTEDLSVSNPGGRELCHNGSRPMGVAKFYHKDDQQTFFALVVHLKSGGRADSIEKRRKQYQLISTKVNQLKRNAPGLGVIIVGDFNTTGYIDQNEDYDNFQQLIKKSSLINLSQNIQCSSYWWGGIDDGKEYPSQLDHILISNNLRASSARVHGHCAVAHCQVSRPSELGVSFAEVSDHCPQTATLK